MKKPPAQTYLRKGLFLDYTCNIDVLVGKVKHIRYGQPSAQKLKP